MKYTGELGTYERGYYAECEASSPEEALHTFEKMLQEKKAKFCDCDDDDQYVSQIHEGDKNGPFVYDYMNGFGIYKGVKK